MGWTWSLLLTQRKVSLSLSYCFTVRWALTLTTMSTTPGCFVCLVVLIVCICFCLTTNNSLRFTPFTPRTLIISSVLKEAMFFSWAVLDDFPHGGNMVLSLDVNLAVPIHFIAVYICVSTVQQESILLIR